MPTPIIFSDVDGSLLDTRTYSATSALRVLRRIQRERVPLILTSSKTRKEMMKLVATLKIHHPFIVENGAAIFIPKGYFPFPTPARPHSERLDVIRLGIPYTRILLVFRRLKRLCPGVIGYSDMTPGQIHRLTGLSLVDARLAKAREHTESFLATPGTSVRKIQDTITRCGLYYTRGGQFHYLMGPHEKGRSAKCLIQLLRRKYGRVVTCGIGDSPNDRELLRVVHRGYLLPMRRHRDSRSMDLPGLVRISARGGRGWSQAVDHFLAPYTPRG